METKRFQSLADTLKKQGADLVAKRQAGLASQQATREELMASLEQWEQSVIAPVLDELRTTLTGPGDLLEERARNIDGAHVLLSYVLKGSWAPRGLTLMITGRYPQSFTLRVTRTGSDAREFKRDLSFDCDQDKFADVVEEGIRGMVLGDSR